MRGNGENIRVASSKEVMVTLAALLIFSTLICLGEQTVGWAIYFLPIVCIFSLIYYPIKAKEMGLWEWEKQ